jgi:hypothetical protein
MYLLLNSINWYESNSMPWIIALLIGVLTVITNLFISIYTRKTSITIAKQQITNSGLTQFRKQWIDNLTNSISLFVAKAEMISMLEFDDYENYDEHFQELSQMHYKIELLLNPLEEDHLELVCLIGQIRDIIHDEEMEDDKIENELDNLIAQLMKVAKTVLKREWNVVKNGNDRK